MQKKEPEQVCAQKPEAEEAAEQEKQPFVPSPTSKRILAWILFVIVFLGLIFWLLGIAFPTWVEDVRAWALGLIG